MLFTECLLCLRYLLRALHLLWWNLIFTTAFNFITAIFLIIIIKHLVAVSQAWHFVITVILFIVSCAKNAFLLHILMFGFLNLFKSWLRYDSTTELFSDYPIHHNMPIAIFFFAITHHPMINIKYMGAETFSYLFNSLSSATRSVITK